MELLYYLLLVTYKPLHAHNVVSTSIRRRMMLYNVVSTLKGRRVLGCLEIFCKATWPRKWALEPAVSQDFNRRVEVSYWVDQNIRFIGQKSYV